MKLYSLAMAAQIIEALREWETGSNNHLSRLEVTTATVSRRDDLHKNVHTKVLEYVERYELGWYHFSQRVRSIAITHAGRGFGNPTNEVSPQISDFPLFS